MNEFMNVVNFTGGNSYNRFDKSNVTQTKVNGISNKVGSWQFKTNTGKYLKTVALSAESQDSIVLSMVHKDKVLFKTLYDPGSGKFWEIPHEGPASDNYRAIRKALTPESVDQACRQIIDEAQKLRKLPTMLKKAVAHFKI